MEWCRHVDDGLSHVFHTRLAKSFDWPLLLSAVVAVGGKARGFLGKRTGWCTVRLHIDTQARGIFVGGLSHSDTSI